MNMMMTWLFAFLFCVHVVLGNGVAAEGEASERSVYDFQVKTAVGEEFSLSEFTQHRFLLVVNVASQCGFTGSNYKDLKKLDDVYRDKGLRILAFPCNQFGGQEPADINEILQLTTKEYDVDFAIFNKVDVNGPHAHPLFLYLQEKLPGLITNDIKWNFTKFLIVDGQPYKRFGPSYNTFNEIDFQLKKFLEKKEGHDEV